MIKDLVVILHRMPEKSLIMDVVVAYVPPIFFLLLSRSWVEKLKDTLQMDLSYATIPVFSEQGRLYKENCLAYKLIKTSSLPESWFGGDDLVVRYLGRGILVFGIELDHASCLL